MQHGITIENIEFADGVQLKVQSDAIVVVTGPNNSGKTTFLNEIYSLLRKYGSGTFKGRIVKSCSTVSRGTPETAYEFLKENFENGSDEEYLSVNGGKYKRSTVEAFWTSGEIPKSVEEQFVDWLDPRTRLGNTYYREKDDVEKAADLLYFDETSEISISDVFQRAFGVDLILHRERAGGVFHIGKRSSLPSHKKRLTPQYRKQIDKLPKVMEQGAGIRSFARIALQILTSMKTIFLIDEPELFLHPPQARHLARLIASDTRSDTQVFLATHSEAFVKGILDFNDARVTVIRLTRKGEKAFCSILKSADIRALWTDPLLEHQMCCQRCFTMSRC